MLRVQRPVQPEKWQWRITPGKWQRRTKPDKWQRRTKPESRQLLKECPARNCRLQELQWPGPRLQERRVVRQPGPEQRLLVQPLTRSLRMPVKLPGQLACQSNPGRRKQRDFRAPLPRPGTQHLPA
ncbi:hypothetical protein D3C80_1574330 [compost metagenome]